MLNTSNVRLFHSPHSPKIERGRVFLKGVGSAYCFNLQYATQTVCIPSLKAYMRLLHTPHVTLYVYTDHGSDSSYIFLFLISKVACKSCQNDVKPDITTRCVITIPYLIICTKKSIRCWCLTVCKHHNETTANILCKLNFNIPHLYSKPVLPRYRLEHKYYSRTRTLVKLNSLITQDLENRYLIVLFEWKGSSV